MSKFAVIFNYPTDLNLDSSDEKERLIYSNLSPLIKTKIISFSVK